MRAAVLAVALAGCFSPDTVTCADGTTCPTSKACAPAGGGCVEPEQIAACSGLGEGANCAAAAVVDGACLAGVCTGTSWTATASIGGHVLATAIGIGDPHGGVVDHQGNLFVADSNNHRIVRVDADGIATVVAGTGIPGFSGDGGPATSANLNMPWGVALDGLGSLYIADTYNQRIRRVDSDGVITTVAGSQTSGYFGDNAAATFAELNFPSGVAVDGLGNLYIVDSLNQRIRRVDTSGIITTAAGTGSRGSFGDGGPAKSAALADPSSVAVDAMGNVFIADSGNNRIRKIDGLGIIDTVVGVGGADGFSGDGGAPTAAQLANPTSVAVDEAGVLYIVDRLNVRIRRVAGDVITSVAGNGMSGYSGDGGPALGAQLGNPLGVAPDGAGNLYIADSSNNRIRRVDGAGVITTIAGNGLSKALGEGGAATCVALNNPGSVAVDPRGGLVFSDTSAALVRRVDAAGVITTVAGGGVGGDGGPATSAKLGTPEGLVVDAAGNLYIADAGGQRVRRVDPMGMITTVAGTGTTGYAGDGGPATSATLSGPNAVALDAAGNLYIADAGNAAIRKVDTSGRITTIAGDGTAGSSGDGGPATSAELHFPSGVAVDTDGSVYIADNSNNRIRRVDPTGTITTYAGGGTGDDGPATSAQLSAPVRVALDAHHDLFIADSNNVRIRRVDPGGTISTVAGMAMTYDFLGDGGPAVAAQLKYPFDIAVDADGRLYIDDLSSPAIRRVDTDGIITTVVGALDPGIMGPIAQAQLGDPRGFVTTPAVTLVAGGSSGTVQAITASGVHVVAGRYPQTSPTGALARFRDRTFGTIGGVAYDPAGGRIYLTESTANRIHVVTIVDAANPDTWTIAPLANTLGKPGFADGAIASAQFRNPTGLLLDGGVLYIADTDNHAVRALDLASATVRTVAGIPANRGNTGDGGPATAALLFAPAALTRCANGDFFVADTGNDRVRRIAASTGIMTTVLGDGTASSSGEGGPASAFPVDAPQGVACDELGNVFVAARSVVRMLPSDAQGVVDGRGAVRTIYGLPPRDTSPASLTRCLAGLAVVDATTVRVTDSCTGIMVELRRQP